MQGFSELLFSPNAINMGRYVPPDQEGVLSFNQASGKNHALGSRARKINQGILTVRFEMPFPIWCATCPKPTIIGQGVRFNAEKKQIGSYFSTPIYAFRMKHNVCGGAIEIRTDPKTTAYVVAEGGKKRDTGEDRLREGEVVIGLKSEEEKKRLENDPFAALEEKIGDRKQAASEKSRIEELYRAKERDWDDPGEANKRLRKAFRADRKVRQRQTETTDALQEKMGLGMELLEETEDDRKRAGFVEFGELGSEAALEKAQSKPLFAAEKSVAKPTLADSATSMKGDKTPEKKDRLRQQVGSSTRAVLDPFLGDANGRTKPTTAHVRLVKRKNDPERTAENQTAGVDTRQQMPFLPLVDYDSD
ncbi:MAG: hypothetical protein Q9217_003595 [Psora testacea]